MANSQKTEDQHFVPKLYLKKFADDKGFVQVLNVKEKRILKRRPYAGVGYEKFFYAVTTGKPDEVSQVVENWLQQIEDAVAKRLPHIIKKISNYEHIDENDRYMLSVFMSMLWLRSPKMRHQLNMMHEDMTKQVMSFYADRRVENLIKSTGVNMSDAQKAEVIKIFENGDYDISFSNTQHLRLMTEALGFGDKGFANLFFAKKWRIYIARGNEKFMTSDSPVIEYFKPPTTFYGTGFLDRDHYLTLTPEIFLELLPPCGSTKVKRKTIFSDQDAMVKMFNYLIASFAHQYAYSGNRDTFEGLLSGFRSPGVAETMYHHRFGKHLKNT